MSTPGEHNGRPTPAWFLENVLTHADGLPLGQRLDPWQREDFDVALRSPLHPWRERPRGHSKSQDAAAFALTTMLTGGRAGQRIYFCATDFGQAALIHDSLKGFVRRHPVLSKKLRVTGDSVSFPAVDSTITTLPADAAGSWGLRPSLIIADELSQWRSKGHEETFWSLWSSLGKVPGARLLCSLTASWDRTSLAWRVRELVKDDPGWAFSVRGQCASWITPEFLAQQKRILPDHLYRTLHMNEWATTGGEYVTPEEIAAIFGAGRTAQSAPTAGIRYRFGLDLGTTSDRTALAIVHDEGDTIVLDALALWEGSSSSRVMLEDVEGTILELAARFRPVEIILDPHEGLLLAERLRGKHLGLRVTEYRFTPQSRAALFETLLQVVRQRRFQAFRHQVFETELTAMRWTERAGILRPDHPASGHDDSVVSVALGVLGAVRASSKPNPLAGGISGPTKSSLWAPGVPGANVEPERVASASRGGGIGLLSGTASRDDDPDDRWFVDAEGRPWRKQMGGA